MDKNDPPEYCSDQPPLPLTLSSSSPSTLSGNQMDEESMSVDAIVSRYSRNLIEALHFLCQMFYLSTAANRINKASPI
uniref:Uncharacterized protein n=1 Tax=Romanomermis culicivorax TaxID=13658 RepID=A0A915IIS6_ROMCU